MNKPSPKYRLRGNTLGRLTQYHSTALPISRSRQALRRVPEITLYFWIIKLLTTAMGESTADFFVFKINPYLAVILSGVVLVIVLILQLSRRRYTAWAYWLCVTMVAVFGTMAADATHIQLGIPYVATTLFFSASLAVVFYVWYRTEKTLSIHSIVSARRELFYWAAVMATFALGTAAGDMTATTIGLGYFSSGLLFAVLFAVPAIAYSLGWLGEITAFWFAYIITRPLGASFADWLGKAQRVGGRGYGDGHVALVLTFFIVCFVLYLTITRKDVKAARTTLH